METSLKIGFAQIFSCCPKNLSCPNFGGAAATLARPARTPMIRIENKKYNEKLNKAMHKFVRVLDKYGWVGQGEDMYVPSLNFKYGHFPF